MRLHYKIRPRFPTGPNTVIDIPLDGPMSSTLTQGRSQNANHATLVNSPTFQYPGLQGLGADESRAGATLIATISYPVTIMSWIKISVANENFLYIGVEADGLKYCKTKVQAGAAQARAAVQEPLADGDAVSIATGFADSAWHHFAGVFKNTTSRSLYINGVLQEEDTEDVGTDSLGDYDVYSISGNPVTNTVNKDNITGDAIIELRNLSVVEIKNHYELTRYKYGV